MKQKAAKSFATINIIFLIAGSVNRALHSALEVAFHYIRTQCHENVTFMRIFTLSFILLLSSCGLIECVDHQFERKAEPINGESIFTLTFANGQSLSHIIKCEKYYDSTCTERGNGWRVREVAKTAASEVSYLTITSKDGVSYELELPNCEEILESKSQILMKDISIVINKDASETVNTDYGRVTRWLGKRYRYLETTNGVHLFKRGGFRDVPLEIIEFEFELSLNGNTISN